MGWKDSNEGSDERSKVSWNISSSQSQHVFELMKKATNFYLKGDLGNWYWTLSALRENINYELTSTERGTLDTSEKQCNLYLIKWEGYLKSLSEGRSNLELKKSKLLFSASIRKYQREILDTLKDHGFFPDKEDRTKLSF